MNREGIKQILPHREPMLLVDEAELVDGVAVGLYTVRGDEFFLRGHFPDNAVVPGVMLCEMMGQAACLLIDGMGEGSTPYFTGLDKVRFKRKVLPGDTVVSRCELVRSKPPFHFIRGQAFVKDELCAGAELSFAVMADAPMEEGNDVR